MYIKRSRTQFTRLPGMRETHTQSLRAGDQLLFHGRELTLSVTTTLCKPAVRITSQQLQVNFYRNLPQPPLPLLLTRWYRSQALSYLKERTCFWTKRLGVSFNRITIKDQRSRWGSCSSLHNLNYNWRIIMDEECRNTQRTNRSLGCFIEMLEIIVNEPVDTGINRHIHLGIVEYSNAGEHNGGAIGLDR